MNHGNLVGQSAEPAEKRFDPGVPGFLDPLDQVHWDAVILGNSLNDLTIHAHQGACADGDCAFSASVSRCGRDRNPTPTCCEMVMKGGGRFRAVTLGILSAS